MSQNADKLRGRRPRGPSRPLHERMAIELDRVLLRILKDGVHVIDRTTGALRVDARGKPVFRPAGAAHLAVVRARIRDLAESQRMVHPFRNDDSDRLIREAEARMKLGKLPALVESRAAGSERP